MAFNKILVTNTKEDSITMINLDYPYKKETVSLYNLKSLNPEKEFLLGKDQFGPTDLIVNKDGYIYIVNSYDDSILKIDFNNKEILDFVKVGRFPISIKEFENNIYVSNSDSNSISIIDEETFSLVQNIPLGEKPTDIQIDEKNYKIYVANSNGYSLDIINLKDETTKRIKLNENPIKIILEANKIYILSYINNGVINHSNLSILDFESEKVIIDIKLKGITTNMIKIKEKDIFYLSNAEDECLYNIDLTKGKSIKKIYLGGMPSAIAWDGEDKLYITNIVNNEVEVLDISTNKVLKRIRVGKEPNGLILL